MPEFDMSAFDAPAESSNTFDMTAFGGKPAPGSGFTRQGIADPLISASLGILSLPETTIGFLDTFTNGAAGKTVDFVLDDLGKQADTLGLPAWARPSQWTRQLNEAYSPEMKASFEGIHEEAEAGRQRAEDAGAGAFGQTMGQAGGAIIGAVKNPRAAMAVIGENLAPMKAIAKVTQKIIGPIATELDADVQAGRLTAEEANAKLAKAAITSSAIGEGVITTGQVGSQISAENPEADLEQRILAAAAGLATGGIARGAGAVMGDVEAGMAAKAIGRQAGGISGGVIERIGKGLISEGFLQEFPQSVQEQIFTNLATNKPWNEGVGEQAILGFIAGGALGAGYAAVQGQPGSPFTDPTKKPLREELGVPPEPPGPAKPAVDIFRDTPQEPKADETEPRPERRPTITPITDIVRARETAILEIQDIKSRIDMLVEQGRVVPNFLYEDLSDAQNRFADAKNARPADQPEPPTERTAEPMDIMETQSVTEAIETANKALENPAPFKDTVEVTAAALDNYIAGRDYEDLHLSEDQDALNSVLEGQKDTVLAQDGTFNFRGSPMYVVSPSTLPITSDDPQVLTQPQYEALSAVLRAEGKRVVVYNSQGMERIPDGMVNAGAQPGVIFIANHSTVDPITVGFHEVGHLMEGSGLYNAYVRTILENVTPQAKALAHQRHGKLSDEALLKEIAADIKGDAMRDKGFWEKVFAHMSNEMGESKAHAQVLTFLGQLKEMIQRAVMAVRGSTFTTPGGQRLANQYVKNLEKVHDALARAVADKYIKQGYGSINAPAEILRTQQLKESKKAFNPVIPPPEAVAAFKALGDAQRGAPEEAMIKVQTRSGGGVINPVVEHVGDLTHRLTEMSHYGLAGQPYVLDKVNRAINLLSSRYGFEKEFNENIKNNATYYKKDPTQVRKQVHDALREYAAEHRKLPVYNEMQFWAREAAVAVGEKRWDDALKFLKQIKSFADKEPKEFHEKAFETKLGAGKAIPYVDVDAAGQPVLEQAAQFDQERSELKLSKAAALLKKQQTAKLDAVRAAQEEKKRLAEAEPMMVIGMEKVASTNKTVNALVAKIRQYSAVKGTGTNAQLLKELEQTMVKNILWLHDLVPANLRERAKRWYDGAHRMNKELAGKYGISDNQAHAVMAVLSPQKDWFMNVSLAERTLSILRNHSFEAWTPAMTRWVESYKNATTIFDPGRQALLEDAMRLEGQILEDLSVEDAAKFVRVFDETYHERTYRTVTPEGGFLDYTKYGVENEEDLFGSVSLGNLSSVAWGSYNTIEKAVSIYRNGSDKNIAENLGKADKVQNFFRNMSDPNSAEGFVTIDTHAVAAALLKAVTGNSDEVTDNFQRVGMYKIFADAYREAAKQRGMLPREMQSVTWEAVRGLFPWTAKKTLAPKVDQIWKDYRDGKIKQQAAREKIYALAGGIRKFMWQDGGQGLTPTQGGESFATALADDPTHRKERVIAERQGRITEPEPIYVNIGLNVGPTKVHDLDAVTRALTRHGVTPTAIVEQKSDSEDTAVVTLDNPLSPAQAKDIAIDLEQEAIVQTIGREGKLYGPNKTPYGKFDPSSFVLPDGTRMQPQMGLQFSEKMIELDHYSKVDGLTEIDPRQHGTGQAGAELRRKANAEPGMYVNRSYYYRAGSKPEDRFRHLHKYSAQVDESKLLDIAGMEGDLTAIEKQAKKAGYLGYYNSEGADPNAIALFYATPATAVDQIDEEPLTDGDGTNYPTAIQVRVKMKGQTFEDEMTGLNAGHALYRAKENWPGAKIEILNVGQNAVRASEPIAPENRLNRVPEGYVVRYEVYDRRDGTAYGNYESRKRARNVVDKKDLEYGAVRYNVREIAMRPGQPATRLPIYAEDFKIPDSLMGGGGLVSAPPAGPRAQPAAPPPQAGANFPTPVAYDPGDPTGWDKFIRVVQDKNIDIQRMVDSIKEAGGYVPPDVNPVFKEEMYHKRAEQALTDFKTDELMPLTQAMRTAGVKMEDLNKYLHARHILDDQINSRLQGLNPTMANNTALGGMSDADAQAVMATADRTKLDPIVDLVDQMITKTRQLMVDYGLESQQTIDAWENEYQSYVPLRREGFDDQGYPSGSGRSVRGSMSRTRLGSEKDVSNILANIALAREQTVVRGEKQKPVIAMAGMLMLNPNKDIATLAKPAPIQTIDPQTGLSTTIPGSIMTNAGVSYQVPMIRVYDPRSKRARMMPDPQYKGRDNVVNFRVGGIDYAIVFNEDNARAMEISKAFKNLDTPALNGFLAAVAPYTRYLASINTQYNPIFGIINFVRDVQFASLALGSTPLAGKQKDMLKATVSALSGIYQDSRAIRRGQHPTSATAQLWERFQHVGGPTGYRDMFKTVEDRSTDLERMLNPKTWAQTRTPGDFGQKVSESALFQWLSDYNQTMENSVRLGVFKVGLDQGLSDIEAASYAKNITVNFNKKGQIGAQMGALYAFFNANVQGSARIVETLFDKSGGLSPVGKKIIAGGILLGILQAFGLTLAGFDDDEIPEFVKQRAIVLPAPGTEKGYLQIPMPLGFNLLPNVGRLAAETLIGYVKNSQGRPLEHAYNLLAAVGNSFVPTGGSSSILQEIAPTVADPIAALTANQDWTGKPIYREDLDRSRPTPGHLRTRDTATVWAKALSRGINWVTGGNEYSPGLASPTPDAIDYLIGTATGGVGREASKFQQVASSAITGEEIPVYKVPLLGRFAGSAAGSGPVREQFYERVKQINMAVNEFKGRLKANDLPAEYRAKHPEVALGAMVSQVQDLVTNLNKQKREMIKRGESKDAVRLQEERITALMKRVNDEFSRMTGR